MGSIDGLRQQVEDLKQRLGDAGSEHNSGSEDLKSRLAAIKATLEAKQKDVERLTAEKERLAAENERLAAEREHLAAEQQRLSAENDQLRKLLSDVLAVIDGPSGSGSTKIIREFLAETDPLVKSTGEAPKDGGTASPPADQDLAAPDEPAAASPEHGTPPADLAAAPASAETWPQPGPDAAGEGADDESPALRRIMRRGHRAG